MNYYKKVHTNQSIVITISFSFFIILLFACKKFEPERVVKIELVSITDVDYRSCTAQGRIIDVGEDGITQHGFCWSTSQNPTVADSKHELGPRNSTGNFSGNLNDLIPDKAYYIRAFAQSHDEVFYGDQEQFVTLATREPTVITTAIHNITQTTAQCGGQVIEDGGEEIKMRGVCWSTVTNPTIADSYTDDGLGLGIYVGDLTGLEPATTYFVRAYATNTIGTSYGEELSFDTEWPQSGVFNDPRDGGHEYDWVRMGEQIWMADNLAYLPEVSPVTTSATTPIYYVYDYFGTNVNDAKASDNYKTYGTLYNWSAAVDACPDGWHLPSDDEWKQLEMFLGMSQEDADDVGDRGTNEGSKLAGYFLLWEDGALRNNADFSSSGFLATPGGLRHNDQYFASIGNMGFWWSATEDGTYNAVARALSYINTGVTRYSSPLYNLYKASGLSVRCVKD